MLQKSKEYYENNKYKRKEYKRIRLHKMGNEKKTSLMNIIEHCIVN